MSVYDITLQDPTKREAPPERVLHLAAVDDLVFVTVETYEETFTTRTYTQVAEMSVSLPALREAIELLSHDRDREDNRPTDERGNVSSRIEGQRLVVAPL